MDCLINLFEILKWKFHFDECLSYIQGLEMANQSITLSQREPQGVIRVTASVDFFKYFSDQAIVEFMQ